MNNKKPTSRRLQLYHTIRMHDGKALADALFPDVRDWYDALLEPPGPRSAPAAEVDAGTSTLP